MIAGMLGGFALLLVLLLFWGVWHMANDVAHHREQIAAHEMDIALLLHEVRVLRHESDWN